MLDYPEVVSAAAKSLEPHALPHYALSLASAFNSYYHVHRVISPDSELTKARLKLAMSVRMTLAAVLGPDGYFGAGRNGKGRRRLTSRLLQHECPTLRERPSVRSPDDQIVARRTVVLLRDGMTLEPILLEGA